MPRFSTTINVGAVTDALGDWALSLRSRLTVKQTTHRVHLRWTFSLIVRGAAGLRKEDAPQWCFCVSSSSPLPPYSLGGEARSWESTGVIRHEIEICSYGCLTTKANQRHFLLNLELFYHAFPTFKAITNFLKAVMIFYAEYLIRYD